MIRMILRDHVDPAAAARDTNKFGERTLCVRNRLAAHAGRRPGSEGGVGQPQVEDAPVLEARTLRRDQDHLDQSLAQIISAAPGERPSSASSGTAVRSIAECASRPPVPRQAEKGDRRALGEKVGERVGRMEIGAQLGALPDQFRPLLTATKRLEGSMA